MAAPEGTWTIVVAAGTSTRFGRLKQYELLEGRRVLDWALAAARAVSEGVVLVVPPDGGSRGEPGVDALVIGGATRSASVRAGLAAVPDEARIVLVHDAARPLAPAAVFERVIAAVVEGADAAVPVVPVVDTIRQRRSHDGASVTLDRATLRAVQTPQAFAAPALRRAHADDPEATDDVGLVEAQGGRVTEVDGDTASLKLTVEADLVVARALASGWSA